MKRSLAFFSVSAVCALAIFICALKVQAPANVAQNEAASITDLVQNLRAMGNHDWAIRLLIANGPKALPCLVDGLLETKSFKAVSESRISNLGVLSSLLRQKRAPIMQTKGEIILAIGTIASNCRYSGSDEDEVRNAVHDLSRELLVDPWYANWYLWTLGQFGSKATAAAPVIEKLRFERPNDKHVLEALAEIPPGQNASKIVESLTNDLFSPDSKLQDLAIRYMGTVGKHARAAIPFLIRLIDSPDGKVRETSLRSLTLIGDFPIEAVGKLKSIKTKETLEAGEAALVLLRLNKDDAQAVELVRKILYHTEITGTDVRHVLLGIILQCTDLVDVFQDDLRRLKRDEDSLISAMARASEIHGKGPK